MKIIYIQLLLFLGLLLNTSRAYSQSIEARFDNIHPGTVACVSYNFFPKARVNVAAGISYLIDNKMRFFNDNYSYHTAYNKRFAQGFGIILEMDQNYYTSSNFRLSFQLLGTYNNCYNRGIIAYPSPYKSTVYQIENYYYGPIEYMGLTAGLKQELAISRKLSLMMREGLGFVKTIDHFGTVHYIGYEFTQNLGIGIAYYLNKNK